MRKEILYLQATMLCSIYYVNANGISNHFAIIYFYCRRSNIYYITIATMIFSQEK